MDSEHGGICQIDQTVKMDNRHASVLKIEKATIKTLLIDEFMAIGY